MSYIYLQERGEASLAESYWDIPRYALSRSTPIAGKSYSSVNAMEHCPGSPYGTTLKHLMPVHGVEKLMLLQAVSRAKTSAPPGAVLGWQVQSRACGARWRGWCAKLNRRTCSWKIHLCLPGVDSTKCLWNWPRWGMMRNGACWALATPERCTSGSAYGYWPTPTAQPSLRRTTDGVNVSKTTGQKYGLSLVQAVRLNPAPIAGVETVQLPRSIEERLKRGQRLTREMEQALRLIYPTPNTRNMSAGPGSLNRIEALAIPEQEKTAFRTGTLLNPRWVEWLMGWPCGWTDVEPLSRFDEWVEATKQATWWERDPAALQPPHQVARTKAKVPFRQNRIKATGNGQVPVAVVVAWRVLHNLRTGKQVSREL